MSRQVVRLSLLMRRSRWQTYRTFCREYDRAAGSVDASLIGSWPSRAQLHRWMNGNLKGLPYADHCRVLEAMFPGWNAEQLFEPVDDADEPGIPPVRASTPGRAENNGGAGHLVERTLAVEIAIATAGAATVTYEHHLVNRTGEPISRFAREIWFEYTTGPLVVHPIDEPDGDDDGRQVAIHRINSTGTMAKFNCRMSPPLQPGEEARIAYSCTGGLFREALYWRQVVHRHTGSLSVVVRHDGVRRLGSCSVMIEHPNGSETSADHAVRWNYDATGAVMTVRVDDLVPHQAVTLSWEKELETDRDPA